MLRNRRAPMALLALLFVQPAAARKPKVEPEGPTEAEVTAQARSVYDDLAGNSNPLVRLAAFEGRLALDADEDLQKALQQGLTDAHWPIQAKALGLALSAKGKAAKALKKDATAALDKLLQSGDETDRARGYEVLEANFKGKERLARVQDAAKLGAPEARAAARAKLLAEGGKTAWKVVEAGLAEAEGQPEHKEALAALAGWSDPLALKWAQKNLHTAAPIGDLARGILGRAEGREAKSLTKNLMKAYDKASGEFEDRVRLAVVLAARGEVSKVERTCLAGLKYRDPATRVLAWNCLGASRDLALLGKVRERIMITEEEDESVAAFAWMREWAKAKGEPKVFEVLQAGARSDRRPVRMRAMSALTELRHRPSIALFESSMSEGQTEVRLAAARGLAAVAEPGDEKRIGDFLRKEPDPEVKLALIDGLARIGTP
ncbi:MAG: hypothetical protein KC613_05865, partial [Myxococcales bacterium]|nr:hypothetical protein [Myxococcales bacterium]